MASDDKHRKLDTFVPRACELPEAGPRRNEAHRVGCRDCFRLAYLCPKTPAPWLLAIAAPCSVREETYAVAAGHARGRAQANPANWELHRFDTLCGNVSCAGGLTRDARDRPGVPARRAHPLRRPRRAEGRPATAHGTRRGDRRPRGASVPTSASQPAGPAALATSGRPFFFLPAPAGRGRVLGTSQATSAQPSPGRASEVSGSQRQRRHEHGDGAQEQQPDAGERRGDRQLEGRVGRGPERDRHAGQRHERREGEEDGDAAGVEVRGAGGHEQRGGDGRQPGHAQRGRRGHQARRGLAGAEAPQQPLGDRRAPAGRRRRRSQLHTCSCSGPGRRALRARRGTRRIATTCASRGSATIDRPPCHRHTATAAPAWRARSSQLPPAGLRAPASSASSRCRPGCRAGSPASTGSSGHRGPWPARRPAARAKSGRARRPRSPCSRPSSTSSSRRQHDVVRVGRSELRRRRAAGAGTLSISRRTPMPQIQAADLATRRGRARPCTDTTTKVSCAVSSTRSGSVRRAGASRSVSQRRVGGRRERAGGRRRSPAGPAASRVSSDLRHVLPVGRRRPATVHGSVSGRPPVKRPSDRRPLPTVLPSNHQRPAGATMTCRSAPPSSPLASAVSIAAAGASRTRRPALGHAIQASHPRRLPPSPRSSPGSPPATPRPAIC